MCRRCGCLRGGCGETVRPATVEGLLEVGILVVCGEGPCYGYDLARQLVAEGLAPGPVSPGRLYETLAALAREGALVSWVEEGERGPERRRYQLTPTGEERLRRWDVALSGTASLVSRLLARVAVVVPGGAASGGGQRPEPNRSPDEGRAEVSEGGGEEMSCDCECGKGRHHEARGGGRGRGRMRADETAERSVEERLEAIEELLARLVTR